MKVAVAGTGNFAKYLFEELSIYGHEVIVLTRSTKSFLNKFEQRETDYSVSSLIAVLEDVDALVSTVSDYTNPSVASKTHLNMLQALEQSKKCRTFIPSEWTLNKEDYPEQPMFENDDQKALYAALEKSNNIRWTIISNAWFADYILPSQHRHLPEVGAAWPMDHATKTFTIYGPGTQLIDMTSARDVAKSVAVLLDSTQPWSRNTFISGDQLTWNDLFAAIKKRDPEWTSRNKSLAETVQQVMGNRSPEDLFAFMFEIQGYSGALTFPKEKVQRDRTKFFKDIHYRTVEEILDEAAANPGTII